jgi:hypothetical protein
MPTACPPYLPMTYYPGSPKRHYGTYSMAVTSIQTGRGEQGPLGLAGV